MLRRFQNSPHLLEIAYKLAEKLIHPVAGMMLPGSRVEKMIIPLERLSKEAIFDCRMCGQCVLHHTGMTCPMTCPKNLRNGPCGGVQMNGKCEVLPDKPCIWVQAWERSNQMPVYGSEILQIQTPLNHQLRDSSAWINDLHRKSEMTPKGWME
jgi:hypothetical protein